VSDWRRAPAASSTKPDMNHTETAAQLVSEVRDELKSQLTPVTVLSKHNEDTLADEHKRNSDDILAVSRVRQHARDPGSPRIPRTLIADALTPAAGACSASVVVANALPPSTRPE